jgi:excisionase family DNA binding protein
MPPHRGVDLASHPCPSYLTPQEVATLLRVDKRTVLNWLRARKLKAVRFGRTWHIPADQFGQSLQHQTSFFSTTTVSYPE